MRVASRRRARSLARRAATMIEFAFVLPMFMFMLLFVLDMGHLVLMSGAMQDATFSAARTGAQVGGAGYDVKTGSLSCQPSTGTQVCRGGSTYRSLTSTVNQIPGFDKLGTLKSMSIVSGAVCKDDATNSHVTLRTDYTMDLVTPGLSSLLEMFSGGKKAPSDRDWQMSATAVARCEIVRS